LARINLTERFLSSSRRVPAKGRVDFHDAIVPGMAVNVTDKAHRSYVLIARYPLHPKNPTRRKLFGATTLEQARDMARVWLVLIAKGIDPKIEAARQRAAEQRRQGCTFGMVALEFLNRHASKLAKARECRRVIEGEFVSKWRDRPIVDILPEEVAAAIRPIARRAPGQAHNSLSYLRRLFSWAIAVHEFGLTASPVEHLRPQDLIGQPRGKRERVLTDTELCAVWDAADRMGFPYGPLIRMLILLGQRLSEIADMTWPEINPTIALVSISADRMKGDRAHEIPLPGGAVAVLETLPRFNAGQFVFTTTSGRKPVNGFANAKVRIDKLSGVTGWTFHDIRRTVRTHLSALPVQDLVRELVIAHARPGLHAVYDQHSYRDEKRECLALWESRLRMIISPR
jgi:integrase